jgi:hypothetical protein
MNKAGQRANEEDDIFFAFVKKDVLVINALKWDILIKSYILKLQTLKRGILK